MIKGLFSIFAIALLVAGFGCQNDSVSPAPALQEQAIDLDSPTGGLSTSDEAPAFGEPDKFAAFSTVASFDDPIEKCGRADSLQARGARFFEFRAIWGRLADVNDTSGADPCPLDWSGTLHLDGGIIVIQRTIAFEEDDSISRIDSSTIAWVSHTGPHVDGIQVRLIVPSGSSLCIGCTPTLELSTGPYSRSFTIDELLALDVVSPVDTCGNAISITSVLTPPGCPHGQLMGAWSKTPLDSLTSADSLENGGVVQGTFRGVWVGRGGRISGHLKGVFGLNGAGERVFFGKYIDLTGRFMGILRGKAGFRGASALDRDPGNGGGPGNDRGIRPPRGWFAGEWIDAKANVQGKLKGRWIASEEGKGFFHGIWGMRCGRGFLLDDSNEETTEDD
ncbi:MAG: hypothetical protein WC674_01305 [Candidatus Krumholzibacteriia bacterium]